MGDALTLRECQNLVAEQAVMANYYRDHYRAMEDAYLPDLCEWFEGMLPGRVCEIGPGHGTMIPWWASRGWDVTVVDIMPRGHWISEEFLREWGARYVEQDILAAPLEGEAFDAVVMTQVIPHLHFRADRALRHCASMLVGRGRFVASVLDADACPDHETPYARWRDVPEYGSAEARPECVKVMYNRAAFRDLLAEVFAQQAVWSAQGGVVLFCEAWT